jgi:hypothetical protein
LEDEMPAIASKPVFSTDESFAGLDPVFVLFLRMSLLSLSARIEHVWPNLAAIVGAVRKARNVSQMELGTNRAKKDNAVIFRNSDNSALAVPSDLHRDDRNYRKSGHFSLIANIEQGGRKSTIPSEFVAYLAACSGLSVSTIEAAIAEDAGLMAVSAAIAPVVPSATVSVESAVKAQTPVSLTKAPKARKARKATVAPIAPVLTETSESGVVSAKSESVDLPVKSGTPDMSVKTRTATKAEIAAIKARNGL